MKKLQLPLFVSLAVISFIAVYGFTKEQTNTVVSGGGTTEEFGHLTTYEFNAVQFKNGRVNGHILLKFRAAGGSLWVKVDCLRLFDGNKATLSGIITKVGISWRPTRFHYKFKLERRGLDENSGRQQLAGVL